MRRCSSLRHFFEDYLRINAARGAEACSKRSNDGFIVVKGSVIAKEPVASFSKGFNALREELISGGIIAVGEVGEISVGVDIAK